MSNKILLDSKKIEIILSRLVYQLIENHKNFENTVLLGLQPRGVFLINKILEIFKRDHSKLKIKSGILDYTFFRDDFRRSEKTLSASSSKIDFSIENKNVVLVDDVLFTGRSIRAALNAVQSFGRPKEIQLLTLIDRRFSRELPIQPDYCGTQVDSRLNEKVIVHWEENNGEDSVYLHKN